MSRVNEKGRKALIWASVFAFLLGACSERRQKNPEMSESTVESKKPVTESAETTPASPTTTKVEPRVPFEGDDFRPSLARFEGKFSHEQFNDTKTCGTCHAEIVSEWGDSMHSFASFSNNIYLRSFEDFFKSRGAEKARFCSGCHDPSLLFDPEIELAPETKNASAHLGIGCESCHSVKESLAIGNGSYVQINTPIPFPKEGDAESLKKHLARVGSPSLRAQELCLSCHRATLTPAMGHDISLPGIDELGPWRDSPYNGNQTDRIHEENFQQETCVSCHMPQVNGHASHRFAGGHATFAAMIGSEAQAEAVRKQVEGAASLDIFVLPEDRLPTTISRKGERAMGFDVVIFNERVGHVFPGGAKDLRDTFVEVQVKDADGEVIATSGVEHAKTGKEDYTYILHTRLANSDGVMQREHNVAHFRTPVYDNSIAPRDANVVRYAFVVPEDAKAPLRIDARLRHRRLEKSGFDGVCEASKSELGKQRIADTLEFKGVAPNPCIEQPIIDVSAASRVIGTAAKDDDSWLRYYRYGLGLLHHVQENLGEARMAFKKARELLGEDGAVRHRAMVIQGLAKVSSRQGRTEEAVGLFEEASALVPDHPSNYYGIGETHLRVWQFPEASAAYEKAAKLQPDARVYQSWAIALGSQQRSAEALEVIQMGLELEPRNPHLLRSQMLAYRALEVPEVWKQEAADAFDAYKRDTQAPHVRDRCSAEDEVCRVERTPITVRWMRE